MIRLLTLVVFVVSGCGSSSDSTPNAAGRKLGDDPLCPNAPGQGSCPGADLTCSYAMSPTTAKLCICLAKPAGMQWDCGDSECPTTIRTGDPCSPAFQFFSCPGAGDRTCVPSGPS